MIRRLLRLFAVASIAWAPSVAASARTPAPLTSSDACAPGDGSTQRFLSAPAIAVRAPGGRLTLAVAGDGASRARGLMCVLRLPPGRGMIFAFTPPDRSQNFWMKNTLVPLDMVFVSGSGIVGSVAARVPATPVGAADDTVAQRHGLARYVIELGAGQAARFGIVPGVHLALPAIAAV